MRVLVACERSGRVREAFRRRGHDAWSCDLSESDIPGQHIRDDVRKVLRDGWDLMIAHPPCTYLTVSGNRWMGPKYRTRFPDRQQQREEAIEFFLELERAPVEKIATENPIGIMSTLYRKPDQIIQPWQFGHAETKSTCLWLKSLPLLKPTCIVSPVVIRHKSGRTDSPTHFCTLGLSPDERQRERSKTFAGIAEAMAEQWG